jgi:DNA-binding XRE family transcriptional regulator
LFLLPARQYVRNIRHTLLFAIIIRLMSNMSDKLRKHRKDAEVGSQPEAVALGNEIRLARLAARMTQEELAMVVGVGRNLIIEIEKGSSGVAVGKLLRVLAGLGKKIQLVSK